MPSPLYPYFPLPATVVMVAGPKATIGPVPMPFMGTEINVLPLWPVSTNAPNRVPTAVGRNWTFTVHVVSVLPLAQLPPATTVKSRFAAPWVTAEIPPRVAPDGTVNDRLCVLPVVALTATGPKFTDDWAEVTWVVETCTLRVVVTVVAPEVPAMITR